MTNEIRNDQMTKEFPARSSLYLCFGIPSGFTCRAVAGRRRVILISSFLSLLVGNATPASAQSVTRAEALRIAETYVQHRWQAFPNNVRHGKDGKGIEVHTPDRDGRHGTPLSECWLLDAENLGVAYKWGGTDTVASFDAGIKAGKAAGDVYTSEKRRLDDAAVSDDAVGVDCSGFICRCWKTPKRYSTRSLERICQKLPSVSALRPADIMNEPGGHVLLFVKWLDEEKKRARFYEAAPFSKTMASDRDVNEMAADGFLPMRYRRIHD